MKAIPIAVPTEIIVFNTPEAAPVSSVLAREIITLIKGINVNPLPTPSTNINSGNVGHCNPILLCWCAAIIKNAKLVIVIIAPICIVPTSNLGMIFGDLGMILARLPLYKGFFTNFASDGIDVDVDAASIAAGTGDDIIFIRESDEHKISPLESCSAAIPLIASL